MTRTTEFYGVDETRRFVELDATCRFDEREGNRRFSNWGCIYTQTLGHEIWRPSKNRVDIGVKFNYYLSN